MVTFLDCFVSIIDEQETAPIESESFQPIDNPGQGGQFQEDEWYVICQELLAVVKEGC